MYCLLIWRKPSFNPWTHSSLMQKQLPEVFFAWRYLQESTCVGVSFYKVTGQACDFIKKRLQRRCFPVNIARFLRAYVLKTSTYGWFCEYPFSNNAFQYSAANWKKKRILHYFSKLSILVRREPVQM